MAEISVELIKKLKELSGAGLTDAKKALVEAKGDFDKALEARENQMSDEQIEAMYHPSSAAGSWK